jgi:hypothetical protein
MRIATHGGHRREGLLCGSRTSWHTSLQQVLTIWRVCERSARRERKTDQEDRRTSFAVIGIGRTKPAGAAELTRVRGA